MSVVFQLWPTTIKGCRPYFFMEGVMECCKCGTDANVVTRTYVALCADCRKEENERVSVRVTNHKTCLPCDYEKLISTRRARRYVCNDDVTGQIESAIVEMLS